MFGAGFHFDSNIVMLCKILKLRRTFNTSTYRVLASKSASMLLKRALTAGLSITRSSSGRSGLKSRARTNLSTMVRSVLL